MACMCGDTQCPSCGPAQGNYKCPVCNAWADDGCECTEEEIELVLAAEADAQAGHQALAEYHAECEAEERAWERQGYESWQ